MAEKRKNSEKKSKNIWIYLGWLVVSVLWLLASNNSCPPSYYSHYDEIVSYTGVLARHRGQFFSVTNPVFILVVFNIIALILLFRARKAILVLFLLPVEACACFTIIGSMFVCGDGTTLQHIDTVEFDGKVYHLALGDDIAGGLDVFSQLLILHECEHKADVCRGREIDQNYWLNYGRLSLIVNDNQLQVHNDGDVVYRLDAASREFALPDTLSPISIFNADRIQSFGSIFYDDVRDMKWLSESHTLVTAGNRAIWFHEFGNNSLITQHLIIRVEMGFALMLDETSIALSYDRHYFASTSNDDEGAPTIIRAIEDFSEVVTLPDSGGDVEYSPNGRFFATTHDRQVTVYDTDNYAEIGILSNQHKIEDLLFSPDSQYLAAVGGAISWAVEEPDFVRVWDMETQELVFEYHPGYIYSKRKIAFSPNSQYIAIVDSESFDRDAERYIRVFDIPTQTEFLTIPVDYLNSIVWSQDGSLLIGSSGTALTFWNSETGALVTTIQVEQPLSENGFNALALSSDGTLLAIGLYDGSIQLWGVTEE